jgi:DNA repair exonuclease SbcCD ATPase subunit
MLPCGNCASKYAEHRNLTNDLFISIAVKDAIIEKIDNYIEHLVQTDTENDLEREKNDLERDKMYDKYMEILIKSNPDNDLERDKTHDKYMEILIQLNEKNDGILSRLTSVEDGMKKLKMEVTEVKMEVTKVKMEVTKVKNVVNTFKSEVFNKIVSKSYKVI